MLSTKALVEDCEEPRAGRHSNPGPGRTYECEDVCRKGVMLGFSTMGVTVIMVGYLLLGAVVFSSLEGDISGRQPASLKALERSSPTVMNSTTLLGTLPADVTEYIDKLRNLTVTKLWDMTEKMNILYPANWTRGAADEMLRFQDLLSRKLAMEMMSRTRAGGSSLAGPGQTLPYSQHQPRDWDLARGLLYSLTLITTVGSGCEGVTTGLGRLVSLVYVLVGLPLMILYLGRLGGLLADMVRCLCCPLSLSRGAAGMRGRKEKTAMTPVTPDRTTVNQRRLTDSSVLQAVGSPRPRPLSRPSVAAPTLICVFLLLGYISCSAVLVARIQAWSFANAFYFCFMTLLTVGQGNLSPNQTSLLVCTLYVFIGLILVSTCWHIFQEEVLLKLQQHDEAQTKVQEVAREEGKVASARS